VRRSVGQADQSAKQRAITSAGVDGRATAADPEAMMHVGPETKLVCDGVWKVFGARSARATEAVLSLADSGATRGHILEETGATIGAREVSFTVAPGETFVIMGLSGSGKSTLLRCVACLTPVTRGSVTLDGEELTSMTDEQLRRVRREKLSMVFQHFGLFPHRRVIDNAAYGLEVQGWDRTKRHAKAEEILELVGLSGWGNHYPQQLSGGMQQRVGLARALAVEPDVLFFDEPFSALDPLIRRDMQEELLRLQHTMQRTIVFVTHDFDEAIKLGDRIAIMKDGEFDQVGTAAELLADPATDYVREFTKNVSRAKVVTVDRVTAPLPAGHPAGAGGTGGNGSVSVSSHAVLEDVLGLLVAHGGDIAVVDDDGHPIGVVDRSRVETVLEG
jgi:glycine betaine/proline transport system ATP-binding protein